jgi:hypothetical protein
MGFLTPDQPDIAVPEPSRVRPREPPEKEDPGTQQTAQQQRRRRARGTGRGDTVLTGTLGGSGGGDQTSTLLGG